MSVARRAAQGGVAVTQAASGLPAEHRGYSGVRAGRRCHGNRDGESNDHGQVLIGASVAGVTLCMRPAAPSCGRN